MYRTSTPSTWRPDDRKWFNTCDVRAFKDPSRVLAHAGGAPPSVELAGTVRGGAPLEPVFLHYSLHAIECSGLLSTVFLINNGISYKSSSLLPARERDLKVVGSW
jgi:hypothetical protein